LPNVALSITDFGYVTVRGGFLSTVAIISSVPSAFMDGYIFDDLLSENLKGVPWLTINGNIGSEVSNISLSNIRIADPVGSAPLLLNQSTGTSVVIRNCGWNDGVSLVDPASIPNGLSGIIESLGARATYKLAKQCFQWGQFSSVQGPAIYYANPTFKQYIGEAMQVNP